MSSNWRLWPPSLSSDGSLKERFLESDEVSRGFEGDSDFALESGVARASADSRCPFDCSLLVTCTSVVECSNWPSMDCANPSDAR